jgi:hypothetical protein
LNAYIIFLRCTRGSTIRGQSVRGSNPEWKDTFAIDDKGGEIYQRMRHGSRANLLDAEDRGMVLGGEDLSMQRTKAWFHGEHE